MLSTKKSNKRNKLFIFIIILIVVILYFNLRVPIINNLNKNAVEKMISKNYTEYEIVEKNYKYLDNFWSTYYYIENDSPSLEIECYTTLKNKKTGMYITIPFYHSKYGIYKEGKYGRKNIKQMVNHYEKFWDEVNDFSKINEVEIHVSNAEFSEANNKDIDELIFYIKEKKYIDNQYIIDNIEKIYNKYKLLSDKTYIVAEEKTFESFSPWKESNKYEVTLHNKVKEVTEDDQNYDFYITYKVETVDKETKWSKKYYIYN